MIKVLKNLGLVLTFALLILSLSEIKAQQFPGYFIYNDGLSDNGCISILNSGNSKSFFYKDHIVYQFVTNDSLNLSSTVNNVQLTFLKHNNNCKPELIEPQIGRINEFHGNDPSKWKTNITSYKYLTYNNLYNNIDLKYYNFKNEIKTDFIIHKGGSPDDIKIIYDGMRSISINSLGELVLAMGKTTMIEKIPEAYQIINGIKKQVIVNYVIENNVVGFKVENYLADYELIIDPQLVYSTFIGGSNDDFQYSGDIERDPSGNIYFTGGTNSSNFPVTPGAYTTNGPVGIDVLVVKMNPTATQMIFSTIIGGDENDNGYAIELTNTSNDIIVAASASSGFPTTQGVISQEFNGGNHDASVFKLSNNGSNLIFSTYIGGNTDEYPFDLLLDTYNNIYISGQTKGNFPTTSGVFQPNYGGGPWDAFIAKLNPNATSLLKSTYIGGSNNDKGVGLALDASNNIYYSMITTGGTPTTSGSFDNTFNGGENDIGLIKLSSDFTTLIYGGYLGSNGDDWVRGDLNFDESGNIVVVGRAGSGMVTTSNAYDQTFNGGATDGFIAKVTSDGSNLIYSSYLGGSGDDYILNAKYNENHEFLLTGYCQSNFPTVTCAYDLSFNGSTDAFISVFNSSLNDLLYSTYIGGSNIDNGLDLIPFHDSTILIGETSSSNFPVTTNAYDQTYNGGTDLFLMRHYFNNGTATANAGPDGIICEGNSYTLSLATGTSPATYHWLTSGTGIFNNATILNPIYIPSAADIIAGNVILTLTVTTASCGQVSDQMTLTIRRLAVVFAGNDATICETSGTYNLNEATAQYYTSLSWTTSGTGIFSNSTILHPVYTPSAADIAAGSVTLTLTANSTAPCGSTIDQLTLSIKRQATVFAGVDASICDNPGTYSLSDASANYAVSYAWTSSGTGTFSNSTILHPVYTPSAADIAAGSVILTITATSQAPCTNAVDQMILTIKRKAVVFAGNDASMCETSGTYNLSEATAQYYTSLSWTTSGTGIFSNSTILHPVYTPSAADITAGSVTLTLTANSTAPCGSTTDQLILSIKRQATVFAGVDATICDNPGTYSLSDASANYAVSYAWTSSGTGTFSNSSILHPVYTPSAADIAAGSVILTITATSQAPCANAVDQMILTIKRKAVVFAGNDASMCETSGTYNLSEATAQYYTSLSWTTSGTGIFSNSTILHPVYTPSAADIAAGSVTLTLTANSTAPCGSTIDQLTLSIKRQATVFAGVDASICDNPGTYSLSDASANYAVSYAWTSSGTGTFNNSSILHPVYTPSAADIAAGSVILTITATSQAPCTNAVDQMILTIKRKAVVFAGNNATICETSGTYNLSEATAQYYTSLSWTTSGTGTFSNSTILHPVYTPSAADIAAGSVTLTLTANSTAPCGNTTDQLILSIKRQATVFAGVDASICDNPGTYSLSDASANYAVSYAWTSSGTGTFNNSSILHPVYTPSAADIAAGSVILTITATSQAPCANAVDQMILTIKRKAVVFAGNDATICETSGTYNLSEATAQYYTSLSWTTSGTGTFSNSTILHPVYTPSAADIASGSVTLTLTANSTAPCGSTVDQMNLFIDHFTSVYAGMDDTICELQSYTLNNSTAQNAISIQWTSSGTGNFNDPSILHPVYIPGAEDIINGHIILTVTSSSACNTASDQMNLSISKQSAAYAGKDSTICESVSSFLLSGASGQHASSFIWSTSGLGYFNDPTIINATYYPAPEDISTGFVELSLLALSQNPCADSSDQMTLYFDHYASAFAGNNDTICETAGSFSLNNAIVLHANSFFWVSSGTGSFNDPDTINPIYFISQEDIQNGNVQLILEASSSCNTISDTLDLVIMRQAVANAGPDTAICQGNNFRITNANAQYFSELSWTYTGNGTLENANSLTPTYIPSENETGEILFSLTANSLSPCQSVTDQFLLTINPEPEVYAGKDDTVCNGTLRINSAIALNCNELHWSILPENAGTLTGSDSLTPTFTPAQDFSGNLRLILTANGLLSCSDLVIQDTAEFLILPLLKVSAGPDQVIEPGTSTSFSATVNSGFGECIWNWSPAELFENNSVSNPTTVNLSNSTEFIVVLQDKDHGCFASDTINVFMTIDLLQPIAVIDWDSTFSTLPAHIKILDNDTIPEGMQYQIIIDLPPDHGSVSIISDNIIEYTAMSEFSGIDHFIYKITNIRNTALYDTALVMILVKTAYPDILDPTGFISPNGDNINDLWYIRNINAYPENEVFIFNRWGSLIRKIVNYDNDQAAWRGEDRQNKKVPDGTYYYSIKIGKNVVTGWILVRNTKN